VTESPGGITILTGSRLEIVGSSFAYTVVACVAVPPLPSLTVTVIIKLPWLKYGALHVTMLPVPEIDP
jgi:hypothetical protein